MNYYARPNQLLIDHLHGVAKICGDFCRNIGLYHTGYILGLVHDIGKYRLEWQKYLTDSVNGLQPNQVSHAEYAGNIIIDVYGKNFKILNSLVNCVVSHHTGLHDDFDKNDVSCIDNYNKAIIDENNREYTEIKREIMSHIEESKKELAEIYKKLGYFTLKHNNKKYFYEYHRCYFNFVMRFLFSSLKDADQIDSSGVSHKETYDMIDLKTSYDKFVNNLSKTSDTVNIIRNKIRNQCIDKAKTVKTGVYTLNSPTGSGKTISGTGFAINHAISNSKNKIIYIAPFNSITEQNSNVLKTIFGCDNVIEDYCTSILTNKGEMKYYLDTWDFPIITSSMVNFIESIMDNRSDLRKFHNLENSIIIFDEVQQIPVKVWSVFNMICNFLVEFMDSTIVLCTATQPNMADNRFNYPILIDKHPDLVHLTDDEFNVFGKRVKYVDLATNGKTGIPKTLEDVGKLIISEMRIKKSFLVVVNTKKQAFVLSQYLESMGETYKIIMLTTNKHSVDRKRDISRIREMISSGERVVCVSTNLIEAGVDLDFDSGIRYCGGEDNIIQCAGRINRNGKKCIDNSLMYIVNYSDPDSEDPKQKVYKTSKESYIDNRTVQSCQKDIGSIESINDYYKIKLFGLGSNDKTTIANTNIESEFKIKNEIYDTTIMKMMTKQKNDIFNTMYKSIAEKFHIIEEQSCIIIDNCPEVSSLVSSYMSLVKLIENASDKKTNIALDKKLSAILRKMMEYSVQINDKTDNNKRFLNTCDVLGDRLYCLKDYSGNIYTEKYGLRTNFENDVII